MRAKSMRKASKSTQKKNDDCMRETMLVGPSNCSRKNEISPSITTLSKMDYEDSSLQKYRQNLLPDQSLINEKLDPEIQIKSLKVYNESSSGFRTLENAYTYKSSQKINLELRQRSSYEIQINLIILNNLLMGLSIENTISKGPLKIKKQVYKQGSFAPSKQEQQTSIKIETPGGIMGRGSYTGEAIVKDRQKRVHKQIRYNIHIS